MKKRYFFIFLITCLLITNCIPSQVKDEDKARELYKKAIKLMDEDRNYDEAIKVLKQAQEFDSETIVFPYEIAYSYYLKKDYEQAEEAFQSIVGAFDQHSQRQRDRQVEEQD